MKYRRKLVALTIWDAEAVRDGIAEAEREADLLAAGLPIDREDHGDWTEVRDALTEVLRV